MRRLFLAALVLALIVPAQAADQQAHKPKGPRNKAAAQKPKGNQVASLRGPFRELAEDALDALERLTTVGASSALIYEPARLEALELIQKAERTGANEAESAATSALRQYLAYIEICRVTSDPSGLAKGSFDNCMGPQPIAKTAAFRAVRGQPPQP